MSSSRAVGIDLGTTFSAIAHVNKHGVPEILHNAEGDRITPSVVLFEGDEVIVGNAWYDPDGNTLWHDPDQEDAMIGIANLDADPEGEVVCADNARNDFKYTLFHILLFLFGFVFFHKVKINVKPASATKGNNRVHRCCPPG